MSCSTRSLLRRRSKRVRCKQRDRIVRTRTGATRRHARSFSPSLCQSPHSCTVAWSKHVCIQLCTRSEYSNVRDATLAAFRAGRGFRPATLICSGSRVCDSVGFGNQGQVLVTANSAALGRRPVTPPSCRECGEFHDVYVFDYDNDFMPSSMALTLAVHAQHT
jgi:hypothetical protein